MELKIDKNIPIPDRYQTEVKSFVQDMEIGDSVEVETLSKACTIQTVLRRLGYNSTQRKLENSYRVWRIE